MSVHEILQKIEELPDEERLELFEKLGEFNEVPQSLRRSFVEAAHGELIELEDALQELGRG